ncbi:MAG: DUF1573 domain-containing protein [bacterium]|nr:DUF1573 domain-containing protein [bacterium]
MTKKIVKGGSRTTLWVIIASLVIGGGIIFWSYQNAQTLPGKQTSSFSSGELAVAESSYDFGEVSMAKGLVNHEFVLSNTSSGPVKVGSVETTCMCTVAYLKVGEGKEVGPFGMPGHGGARSAANLTVNPGEKLIVRAVFDPAAHGPAGVGTVERAIIVDVGKQEPVVMSFKALVRP